MSLSHIILSLRFIYLVISALKQQSIFQVRKWEEKRKFEQVSVIIYIASLSLKALRSPKKQFKESLQYLNFYQELEVFSQSVLGIVWLQQPVLQK